MDSRVITHPGAEISRPGHSETRGIRLGGERKDIEKLSTLLDASCTSQVSHCPVKTVELKRKDLVRRAWTPMKPKEMMEVWNGVLRLLLRVYHVKLTRDTSCCTLLLYQHINARIRLLFPFPNLLIPYHSTRAQGVHELFPEHFVSIWEIQGGPRTLKITRGR